MHDCLEVLVVLNGTQIGRILYAANKATTGLGASHFELTDLTSDYSLPLARKEKRLRGYAFEVRGETRGVCLMLAPGFTCNWILAATSRETRWL